MEITSSMPEDGFEEASAMDAPPEARVEKDPNDASRAPGHLREVASKVTEGSLILMPKLLASLEHGDPVVVKQSITTGSSLFCAVLTEIALQLYKCNKVEGWLEEIWSWMVQFKDSVCGILLEHGSVGTKLLAVKFLETCILLFASDVNDNEVPAIEGKEGTFNVSWLVQGHSILSPTLLANEADKILAQLLNILQSTYAHSGSLIITVINCLASIAKRRPAHYETILSALLDFDPNFETSAGGHAASIRHCLRTAFIGFLRCSYPTVVESRDKLLRALRAMYPGEASDQIIRQAEKMSRSIERVSRDIRVIKDDPPSDQISTSAELMRMRPVMESSDNPAVSDEMPAKRTHYNTAVASSQPATVVCDLQDPDDAINNFSKGSVINSDLTPAAKMIAMIGALLAEGERGTESLEILISNIHADLLADIVIETMKHLPKNPFVLSGRNGNIPPISQASPSTVSSQTGSTASATAPSSLPALSSDLASTTASTPASDAPPPLNILADSKRDPRRDPRRLDPRRAPALLGVDSGSLNLESISGLQNGLFISSSKLNASELIKVEDVPASLMSKKEVELTESTIIATDLRTSREALEVMESVVKTDPSLEGHTDSDLILSPVRAAGPELPTSAPSELMANEGVDGNMLDSDQFSPSVCEMVSSEDVFHDLPMLPLYVELTDEQRKALHKLAITRIIEDYKQIRATGCGQSRLPLIARLVAQSDADDDIIAFLQKHIILDYHHRKGHDLAMHVLYHLNTVMISEGSSSATHNYEKFLIAVAKTLLESLPASDKSFSKLFCEAPVLPESALKLLEDLCHLRYDHHLKDVCDGDRVTQGLGAVWSLILGRPIYRQACLDIALKCSVHSQEEVRAKAIRLVANKLFLLRYASENIEQFARSMLMSVVDQQTLEPELKPLASIEERTETGSQETSVSGSHSSEPGASENEPVKGIQPSLQGIPVISLFHAQQQMSLFLALCMKKPSLLHLVFDIYGRVPKVVKQSIHRHIPILVRTLGSSDNELLHIISDPPEGSENLIMLVLQIVTEESTPSSDLIAAVKQLYNTKLKDVAILIPLLSSLSKDEVLPIFPRLVDLPLEKFQSALACILQGSAHTGPALTPVEVLVAIHDIDPEKDKVALKKITNACTACFEQRTVFTHQVLAKSLSLLVEQVPLPLLIMRTVIQAIDAFPSLRDFVMGILSELVSKQVWKMPKIWVGFLKCAYQTQPDSFGALLQLPPPQLESALNKYANLRGPLAAYANQPNARTSLSRQTLKVLGLVSEPQQAAPRSFMPATTLHTSDSSSSVHGATPS